MKVQAYKTKKVVAGDNLYQILDEYLPKLLENEVVVISSKIVSVCEGRIVREDGKITKEDLIKKEADFILPKEFVRYGVNLTITKDILIGSAGIDESNGNGNFILWPSDPLKSANEIRKYLRDKYNIKNLGVIISDSHSSLMRRGALGFSIAWSGFKGLKNYIGTPDIFGRKLEVTYTNIVDALSSSATLVMGEGAEQTPLAVISHVANVQFQDKDITQDDIKEVYLNLNQDVYSAALDKITWQKGSK